MTETFIDGVTVGSGGGTTTSSFSTNGEHDEAVLIVRGDANSSDLTFDVTGVAFDHDGTLVDTEFSSSVSNLDSTTDTNDDKAFRLSNLRGYERVEIQVTNNAASDTTISVEQANY